MKIISEGQVTIEVEDNENFGFIKIAPVLYGKAARLLIHSDVKVYLVQPSSSVFKKLIAVPSEKWKQDLIDDGYEIIGEL